MSLHLRSRAALCQLLSAPVIAITLAGCGGVTMSPRNSSPDASSPDASSPDASSPDASSPDASSPDASSPDASSPDAATGCPSIADIDSGAALGKACSPEGAYCRDQTCDPCTQNCPAVGCTKGVWTQAVGTAGCALDAGPPPCPTVGASGFDQSCQSDSDCVAVPVGTLCPRCLCAAEAINAKDQNKYNAKLQALLASYPDTGPGCGCPAFGQPRCIDNHCVLCGGASPACPDGG